MNLHFPPLFWKQLLNDPVYLKDLECIDAYTFQIIKDIQKYGKELKPEQFEEQVVDEKFECHLSNSKPVELCPGGKEKDVTFENHKEYIDLLVKTRLQES